MTTESARNRFLAVRRGGGVLGASGLNFSIPENGHAQQNIHSFIYSSSTYWIQGMALASGCHSHWFPGYGQSLQSLNSTIFICTTSTPRSIAYGFWAPRASPVGFISQLGYVHSLNLTKGQRISASQGQAETILPTPKLSGENTKYRRCVPLYPHSHTHFPPHLPSALLFGGWRRHHDATRKNPSGNGLVVVGKGHQGPYWRPDSCCHCPSYLLSIK